MINGDLSDITKWKLFIQITFKNVNDLLLLNSNSENKLKIYEVYISVMESKEKERKIEEITPDLNCCDNDENEATKRGRKCEGERMKNKNNFVMNDKGGENKLRLNMKEKNKKSIPNFRINQKCNRINLVSDKSYENITIPALR